MLNTKQYSVKDALQLLGLPIINKKYHILLSESDIIHEPTKQSITTSKSRLTKNENELVDKCINYYDNVYPLQNILYDLQMYPYNLKNVIQFLYKYQNIYVKRLIKDIIGNLTNIGKDNIGKTKTITLKQALQLVKLPSFTSNKMITLSTHKIDKSSFQTYELDLLDTIEDYYKGYCPKKLMIKKLKDYPYSIQPIIQYLYK